MSETSPRSVVLIVGARPNFMKARPLYKALKDEFFVKVIHTGQHHDPTMSDVFFNQLGMLPDIRMFLKAESRAGVLDERLYQENRVLLDHPCELAQELLHYDGNMGQLGEIRDNLMGVFSNDRPDLVFVFGDVTSTLAASLAARRLDIRLAHVESGLRSGDLSMPEEVNRILTDLACDYHFVTEPSGMTNLEREGISNNYCVGNTMIDSLVEFEPVARRLHHYDKLGERFGEYVLITIHRPSNTDDRERLLKITADISRIKERTVFVAHPRTANNIRKFGIERVNFCNPLGYIEFISLMIGSKYVITDSGGIQEESSFLGVPCFTLRKNTERPITLVENGGTSKLIDEIGEIRLSGARHRLNYDLWDGRSSERIADWLKRIDFN